MFRKTIIFLLGLVVLTIIPQAISDIVDNVETAYVFINSVIYDQKGNQVLDFRDKYELRDAYPNKVISAVNTSNPSGALGSNYSTYATIDNGGELKMQFPVFPQDAQNIKVYYMYREWVEDGGFWPWQWDDGHWEYKSKEQTISSDKTGSTSYQFKITSDQTVYMEVIGKEIVFKNRGEHTDYSWWDVFEWFGDDEPTPMYLQVVRIHNIKVPLVFPKIAVDGNRNIYNIFKKYGSYEKKGSNYKKDYYLSVYKNGTTKLFDVYVGEELYRSTGNASYDLIGESLKPNVSLSVNPQGSRVYLYSNLPTSKLYKYDIGTSSVEEEDLGFEPLHMKVSTKNRGEEWIHYSFAHGLSVAETWGPENEIGDCERFELWKNKVYKTSDMYDLTNGEAEEGGYVNMATKDVYGDVLTYYNPGEGFAYSNTGANTSAQFALGNTDYSYTAMGRRAKIGVSMGVEVKKGEKLFIYERSNFKTDEYEFDAKETEMRITTKEGEDYRITIEDKVVHIKDVGATPMKQITKKKKDWIIWPFWYEWEYYTEWVEDPILNDPENFGLTAFYNIAMLKLTKVPYESIQYFAADGYGNKYTVRRSFGPYINWKTTGQVVRHGQAVRYYKRKTFFTLFKLDINNNETELFTSPNIGWSYYYRTESPWPPGSCGCKGVMLSDYIPIYEAVAEADLATNNYAMPPKPVGVPIVDIKTTPVDAPKLQNLGVTGELFMDINENSLVSETVAASNDVKFENYDGIEWGHKVLNRITTPEGKRGAPAGFINTHNPYLFVPNEYFYRYNIVEQVNRDVDLDLNAPDGAVEPNSAADYQYDWAVTGGGFPSNTVLGRHKDFDGESVADPRLDSRYYVWAIRRLAILNPAKEGEEEIVNAETPWTVVNHGSRDYVNEEYAASILRESIDRYGNEEQGMAYINPGLSDVNFNKTIADDGFDSSFLGVTGQPGSYMFKPGDYRFDDGGIYDILLAAGYRYIDWYAMREESDGGDLKFWWDEPEYIKDMEEPMRPDVERIIVRAYEPEDRPNLLEVVIDGDTNGNGDYDNNKMMSNWQSFDDDGDGVPDHAVIEMNEDFAHRFTAKIVQKDRYGNIVSDNEEILFVPNRDQQQEIRDQIEPGEQNKEQNLEIADKYSGVAFKDSRGSAMHYQWKIQTMVNDQIFGYNYYTGADDVGIVKDGTLEIDIPYVENNYQPWESRVEEGRPSGERIYGEDGMRRPSELLTNFNVPTVPNYYRVTFTLWYTRIEYFDENGELAYPLSSNPEGANGSITGESYGQIVGYDCKETIEKTEFYIDVYIKDTTLPRVIVDQDIMDGATTGDSYPRDIVALIEDNNPFDGMSELDFNNMINNLDKDDFINKGSKAYLIYPKRLDPNRTPADILSFDAGNELHEKELSGDDGWKWERPSLDEDEALSYLTISDAETAYNAPGIQGSRYLVRLNSDEQDLRLLAPFDRVTDTDSHFKYMIVAEDGMYNYFENARNQISVKMGDSSAFTTFSYPGDENANRQMRNTIHTNEEEDYIERQCAGVPKNMTKPEMLNDNEYFYAFLELNNLFPSNPGTLYPDDDGDLKVYKQVEGELMDGYYGIAEGELTIKDNDPPEVYLKVTNPKRNITIGYYLFDKNNADGIDGDDDIMSYPFRDETEYDEAIKGLLALEDESDRGQMLVAVGGGDSEIYNDPEINTLPDTGRPMDISHMVDAPMLWYGNGFVAGGGSTGGVKDETDFFNMLYDFETENDISTLMIEEDMRIKIELAAVDNVAHRDADGDVIPLSLSLDGEFKDNMLFYPQGSVGDKGYASNSAVYITNFEDGTGSTPNITWSDAVSDYEHNKIVGYYIFRESTREDDPDEYMYVRVRDNAAPLLDECNEVLFRIPVRIINVQLLDMKIHEMRKEDRLD